jgi:ribosomal protein S18 acetylase RimI-like enzyme
MASEAFPIRSARPDDASGLQHLYRTVAERSGGIIRIPAEITAGYVAGFLAKSLSEGYSFVVENPDSPGEILAETHTYSYGIFAHRHILTDLTICVHPDWQGQGFGKKIFQHLLQVIENERNDILRVELWVREHNSKAVAFYEKLGFVREGRFEQMIWNADGSFDTPLGMAWVNPTFRPNNR